MPAPSRATETRYEVKTSTVRFTASTYRAARLASLACYGWAVQRSVCLLAGLLLAACATPPVPVPRPPLSPGGCADGREPGDAPWEIETGRCVERDGLRVSLSPRHVAATSGTELLWDLDIDV